MALGEEGTHTTKISKTLYRPSRVFWGQRGGKHGEADDFNTLRLVIPHKETPKSESDGRQEGKQSGSCGGERNF